MDISRQERLIVALDTNDLFVCRRLIDSLSRYVKLFKVGKELFTACGNEAVSAIHSSGARCFLDLKYHDIPNTVAKASTIACRRGIFMFNMHASGGLKMMKAAREAVTGEAKMRGIEQPVILGVTVLTSLSESELQNEIGISRSLEDQVLHLARLAKEAGLDGVVASAREITLIKEHLGQDFLVVTPGIRPAWASKHDQTRVVTPGDAFDMGADYIVIGRPITASADPAQAVRRIISEL